MNGKRIKVIDTKVPTFGKIGVVDHWENSAQKYAVDFDNGWIGWYRQDQMEIINENNQVT